MVEQVVLERFIEGLPARTSAWVRYHRDLVESHLPPPDVCHFFLKGNNLRLGFTLGFFLNLKSSRICHRKDHHRKESYEANHKNNTDAPSKEDVTLSYLASPVSLG